MSAFNYMSYDIRMRNWGGTSSQVAAEPYISGYSYIKWIMPPALTNYLLDFDGWNDQSWTTSDDASGILESACTGVTPPGGTLNKAEFQGIGGVKWSVPTSIDYGNTITLKYVEFSGLPILRIHRAWVNMIRDNKTGYTALDGNEGIYHKAEYAATLLYWTTKPDGYTVEYYAAYSGIFPTKDPQDSFNGDITSIDKLEIDIDYNVDMIYHEPWVYDLCDGHATDTHSIGNKWDGNNKEGAVRGIDNRDGTFN